MKWFLVRSTALLLLLAATGLAQDDGAVSSPTIEAYKFDFTGGGARAEGMGKAFIGVSDDITAGSWNPAGLYIQEKPVLSFSYGSLAPRGSTNMSAYQTISEFDHTGSFNNITSLNFVAPIRIKGHHFVGSFNFTRNFDEFQGYGLYWADSVIIAVFGKEYTVHRDLDHTSELQGGLNSVNIGFGTRLYRNISFGASLNIYTGEIVKDQATIILSDSVPHYFFPGAYLREIVWYNMIDTNQFSGYNFNIGFKLNGDKVDVGLVLRTPFSMNIKTGRSIYTIVEHGDPIVGEMQIVGGDTTYFDDLLAKYDVPLMVGVGVAYKANENLLLAADAEYRRFSGGKVDLRDSLKIDPGGHNEEYFTEYDPDWNNVFAVRAGGEYLYQTGIGLIPIRAGAGYVPVPAPNLDISGGKSTVVSYNFSFGSGIHWSQIYLDWAYTYTTSNWVYGAIEYKNRDHHLNFSFTGYF